MDRTIVPTNFGSWPKIKGLIPDHKLILLFLWQNPSLSASGCYFLDLDVFAAFVGFDKRVMEQAIKDFEEKKLIKFDWETSEVLIFDWWRFHKCESPQQISVIQKSVDKIQSESLKNEFFERIKHFSNKINDLRSNYNLTKHNLTQQQPEPSPSGEGSGPAAQCGGSLIFPSFLNKDVLQKIEDLARDLDQLFAQQILDVLAARADVKNPIAFFKKLASAPASFDPTLGLQVAAARLKKKEVAAAKIAASETIPDAAAAAKGAAILAAAATRRTAK